MSASLSPLTRLLRRPWYALWRTLERAFYEGREYGIQVPTGHRLYMPWFAPDAVPEFSAILRTIRNSGQLSLSPDRAYLLYSVCRSSLRVHGDVAECGVFRGGSAQLLAMTIGGAPERMLHLFDTFAGMPDASRPARDYHRPGDFSDTSLGAVRERLRAYPFCRFHPGTMPDTFDEVAGVPAYAFVHVDVDIYPSTLECCRWFWPRLTPGGAMVIDDYGFYPYRHAVRAAVDAFFANRPETPIPLPTGQALVIKGHDEPAALPSQALQ